MEHGVTRNCDRNGPRGPRKRRLRPRSNLSRRTASRRGTPGRICARIPRLRVTRRLASQHSILAAAEQAFTLLPKQLPVYIVSESLGAGVAAHLAKVNGRDVSGLMFFAPYDKLVSVGQRHMRFLPVSWLLWDRFEPSEWLREYRGPAGFVLAGADQVIPSELGRRLYDSYRGPKRLQLVPGAGHNDVATQSSDWWREAFSFWQHP